MSNGYLEVELFTADQALPVNGTSVNVRNENGEVLYRLITDKNGHTEKISLEAPSSAAPEHTPPPFAAYTVEVPAARGYKRVVIYGVQIFEGISSVLPVEMHPVIVGEPPENNTEEIYIPKEHGVEMPKEQSNRADFENYAMGQINIMELPAANEVLIPNYITVHLGSPNANARNVKVPFKEYVKNVASSEIFPTWNENAIIANIYSQISFVLNRIHTVWYRSRGKDFDITNSTAFDQFFVEGRNIFENISRIVDVIFNNFIRRPGRREPFFASYCNGTTVTCEGLSQWGSQDLAVRGYTPIQILRYYFPQDVQIVQSTNFSSKVGTFPGDSLSEGDRGENVRLMQMYLNRISGNWYINPVTPDGVFGSATKNTVMQFQRAFGLIPDGIIGKGTWYEITRVYVAVKELAELTSEGERISVGASPPTVTVQMDSRGAYVVELQFLLNFISTFFNSVPNVIESGVFRDDTKRSVIEFQKAFGLTPDGVVGPATWRKLYDVYHSITETVPIPPPSPSIPPFPGVALRIGSTGNDVLLMQNYLNAIRARYPSIPAIVADGVFGPNTQAAVIAFQKQFGLVADGVIGQITWYSIVEAYNNLPPTTAPSYPGTPLTIGSRGAEVEFMQTYLNAIGKVFPVIPLVTADGIFGSRTQEAVKAFQTLFGLSADGIIGRNTWDKIVYVFNNLPDVAAPQFPGTALRVGSRGNDVIIMQKYLNTIATLYPSIPTLTADGIFGPRTEQAVTAFQRQLGTVADGVIGINTWNQIVSIYNLILMNRSASGATISAYSTSTPYVNVSSFEDYARMMLFSMLFS